MKPLRHPGQSATLATLASSIGHATPWWMSAGARHG
jgi:hypothetical protein